MRGPCALGARPVPRLLRPLDLPDDEVPVDPHEVPRICQLATPQPRNTRQFSIVALTVGATHEGSLPEKDRSVGGSAAGGGREEPSKSQHQSPWILVY